MKEVLQQSWYFYKNNYRFLLMLILPLSFVQWLLLPDSIPLSDKTNSMSEIRSMEMYIEQMLDQIPVTLLVGFVFYSLVRAIIFICLYKQLIENAHYSPWQIVVSTLTSLGSPLFVFTLFWFLVTLVLSLVGFIFLGLVDIGPIITPLLFGLVLYLALRLSFVPQAIVHNNYSNPILAVKESFVESKGKLLKIIALFLIVGFVLSVGGITQATLTKLADQSSFVVSVVVLLEQVFQLHAVAFLSLAMYRLYLMSDKTEPSSNIVS